MIIAISLSAMIMLALAGGLGAALRALSVQKARTQGNEVATLGIESLQSLSYDALGVCAPAAGAPAELDDPASPAATCDPAVVADSATWEANHPNWGEHPCRSSAPTEGQGFIRSAYTCVRNNVTYSVRRYVAWGNLAQTDKRLAVFVKWTDSVGEHEVSQQSSLRAPGAQDIAGLSPPQLTNLMVAGSTTLSVVDVDPTTNRNVSAVALQATASGLKAEPNSTSKDKVYVSFSVLDDADFPEKVSVFLNTNNGTTWTGEIPASAYRFGSGVQYFVFSTIRSSDGKANSAISGKVEFSGGPVTVDPAIVSPSVVSSDGGTIIQITSAGALVPERIDLTVTTLNSSAADTVDVVFPTRTGALSARLVVDTCLLDGTCTWTGQIPREAGYSFTAGTKDFYFTVAQPYTGPGTGSTDASKVTVEFV